MQLHIEFTTQGLCLPIAYRHYIQSMIYNALRVEPTFSEALHNGNGDMSGRQFKLFTFGQLEGSYIVKDKQICFHDTVSLEIRSVNMQLMLLLLNAFPIGKEVRMGKNLLYVKNCCLENRIISTDEITVRTRSPIVSYLTLSDGQTRFFSPEEDLFYSLLCSNAERKWESVHKAEPFGDFFVTPASAVFQKQVTLFKETRITAWGGSFHLKGDPKLLSFLYNTGLGAKSSQGFGMFTLVQQQK